MGRPLGHGYFFHQETLERIDISEHAEHIHNNPEDFGLTPADVKGLWPNDHRRELMTIVWKRGWVRVRFYGGSCGIEFIGEWAGAGRFVEHIAEYVGFGDFTTVRLFNHGPMTGFDSWPWHELQTLLAGPVEALEKSARPITVGEE